MNGALLRFGEAAVTFEVHARTALLENGLSPADRADTTTLLRHAVGVIATVKKRQRRQKKPTISPA